MTTFDNTFLLYTYIHLFILYFKHNALRGVSPPTCTLIMKVISDKNIPLVVKTTALRCFVTITQVMIQFPPHQVRYKIKITVNFVHIMYSVHQ